MTRLNINGTIYDALSNPTERYQYKIGYDNKMIGGKELNNPKFISNYIEERIGGRGLSHLYICLLVDDIYDTWVSRLICFESSLHKMVWIANNNNKSLGTLNQYVGVLCN